jgi:hypothetical protein
MVLDQPKLQLIFNVITITGVSAFGTISYLLKRDYEKLLAKIDPSPEQDQHHSQDPASPPPAVSKLQQPATAQHEIVPKESAALPAPEARPTHGDIRQFVTQRAQGWTAPSPSQWKPRRETSASALSRRPFFL